MVIAAAVSHSPIHMKRSAPSMCVDCARQPQNSTPATGSAAGIQVPAPRGAPMDRTQTAGAALATVGVAGYGAGLAEPYPGRAFALTTAMVGLALLALGEGGMSP